MCTSACQPACLGVLQFVHFSHFSRTFLILTRVVLLHLVGPIAHPQWFLRLRNLLIISIIPASGGSPKVHSVVNVGFQSLNFSTSQCNYRQYSCSIDHLYSRPYVQTYSKRTGRLDQHTQEHVVQY